MAKVVAVTEAIKSLAEAESRLNLSRAEDETFFTEWQTDLPSLSDSEQTALATLRRRLLYHIADGELLEGAVTLLVASPLPQEYLIVHIALTIAGRDIYD